MVLSSLLTSPLVTAFYFISSYLVQACKVVFGFDQKGLVDPWVINIMSCSCQQSQENIERGEIPGKLKEMNNEQTFKYLVSVGQGFSNSLGLLTHKKTSILTEDLHSTNL